MDVDNIFKIELSLEKISAISVAISFWERPDVKEKIRGGFDRKNDFYYDRDESVHEDRNFSFGRKILNYIFEQFDLVNYPRKLVHQVKILIVKIGEKIFFWRYYVTRYLMLDLCYAETIYWTAYGQVDELKVLKDYWLKDPDFRSQAKCNGRSWCKGRSWCCIISKYALEDFVRSNIEEMKKYILSSLPSSYRTQEWTPYGVIATNIIFCINGIQRFKNYEKTPDELPARDLFNICASYKFGYAAKYFWDKLSEEKLTLARSCLNSSFFYSYHFGAMFLFLYLFKEIPRLEKMEFLMKNNLKILDLVWPYQEVIENVLDKILDYAPEYCVVLLEQSLSYLNFGDVTDKEFRLRIFQILLNKLSTEAKRKYFMETTCCEDLYEVWNFDAVNTVLADPDLKLYRNKILNMGLEYFKTLILKDKNLERIHKFIINLEVSDEEIKPFKENFIQRKILILNECLIQGDINLAKEHLKWHGNSEAELKNGIDAVKIFSIFIQRNKFIIANDFLRLRFDREEERRKIKESFKSDEFLRNKIFQIWSQPRIGTDKAIKKCSDLLNLFLETEEDVLNLKRKEIMKDEFAIEKYWDGMLCNQNFNNFSHFLEFCLHDVEETKSHINSNINWWIDTYKDKFNMIDALFDWVYPNQEKKKNAIKNYMSTPSGVELCFGMFKNCKKRFPDHLLKFFNTWIQPSFDFSEMRTRLDRCDKTLVHCDTMSCFKAVLIKREKDQIVTVTDLYDSMIRSINYYPFCTGGQHG